MMDDNHAVEDSHVMGAGCIVDDEFDPYAFLSAEALSSDKQDPQVRLEMMFEGFSDGAGADSDRFGPAYRNYTL